MMLKHLLLMLVPMSLLFGIGEANFLSLKVHYLNEKNAVTLNADNDVDERIEIFLSILDSDGNLAQKTSDGGTLADIDNDALTSVVSASRFSTNDIDRDVSSKNTARFILDYGNVETDKSKDVITVNIAGLKKTIDVNFDFVKAKGLIVRTATRGIDPLLSQGKYFTNLSPDGDNNLSIHSKTFLGGTVGVRIPLKVYASTEVQEDRLNKEHTTEGRFTRSTPFNNQIVVVKALGDFDADGIADVLVGQAEGPMQDGIASMSMVMEKGMPEDDDSFHVSFNKESVFDGLGIAFIAYLKDDLSISNRGSFAASDLDDPSKFRITGEHNATDVVIVRSLRASNMRVGDFNRSVKFLDDQWSKPYINYYVLDDNLTSTEQNMTLTAIDRYGNPAIPASTGRVDIDYDSTYFDIEPYRNFDDRNRFSIYTQIITMTPNTRHNDYVASTVNSLIQEGKTIYTKLRVLGTGGMSAANAVDSLVYLGRKTTDYMTNKDYSSNLTDANVTLDNDNNKEDFKIVVSQLEINSTKMKVEIFKRYLNGSYRGDDSTSEYSPTFGGSSAKSGVDMRAGGKISISDMKDITIPAFKQSNTTPLDGFTIYLFKEQDELDNHMVILSSSGYAENDTANTDTTVEVGGTIQFALKGLASNLGDYIYVMYGNVNERSHIRLAKSSPITAQGAVFRNSAGDFIGSDLALSVRGYTVSTRSNFTVYVNGHEIIRDKIISQATDGLISTKEGDGLYPSIKFNYKDENSVKNVSQIKITGFGSENTSNGDGTTKTSLLELNDIDGDDKEDDNSFFTDSVKPITYKGKLYANKYYLLLDSNNDLEELDAFGNHLLTNSNSARELSQYDYDITGRGSIGHDTSGVYIRFDERDAGSSVTAEIESRDGKNTIIFTNIQASSTNDYYIISPEKTIPQVNLVNAEITIKVIGNNNGPSDDFSLQLSHSDKNANIYITKIEDSTESFSNQEQTSLSGSLSADGNYYILRTDLPGDITIKAQGLEIDSSGRSTNVSKSNVLRFVNFDRAAPLANAVVLGNSVRVVIEDGSLDYDRTIVEARDSEGITFKKSIRSGNEYTISSLPKGTHQIYVQAVDFFDNVFTNTFSRVITSDTVVEASTDDKNATTKEDLIVQDEIHNLSKKLQEHKEYPSYGKFIAYNATDVYYKNWIFQNASGTQSYQLFATPSAIDPFGFKAFNPDFTKIDSSKWWHMVKLDGSIGSLDEGNKYGWVVISQDLSIVKKLKSIKSDGSLTYTALPLKATLDGSRIVFINK